MNDHIIGYLKFTDHFESLKDGFLFFSHTSKYADKESSTAVYAIEGGVKDFHPNSWSSFENTINGDYVEIPHGIQFSTPSILRTISSGMVFNTGAEAIKHLEDLKPTTEDIYWKIIEYSSTDIFNTNSRNFVQEYRVKAANIMIKSINNWGITCFVAIRSSEVINHHISPKLIHSLTKEDDGTKDNIGHNKPWIFIPKDEMSCIKARLSSKKITYTASIVNYIKKGQSYPFSRGDIIKCPAHVLSCKPISYANQREFRLIVGGPNTNFPGPVDQSVQLINPSVIRSGNNADELRNLQIFE